MSERPNFHSSLMDTVAARAYGVPEMDQLIAAMRHWGEELDRLEGLPWWRPFALARVLRRCEQARRQVEREHLHLYVQGFADKP